MLTTETYTIGEAIEELEDRIDGLEEETAPLDSDSEQYQALQARIDRLAYFHNGLKWARKEWGEDVEIELGAVTAGEKALMHREAPDTAGAEEMQLWYVAAATEAAPYVGDSLSDTFDGVANTHPGFAAWAEATANGLTVFGGTEGNGNGSST